MELKEFVIKLDKSNIKAGDGKKIGEYPLYTCSPIVDKFYNNYLYDTEAIILSTGGNPIINYYNGKFAYSTDCLVIKTNNDIMEKYLYYYLLSKINEIGKMFRGVGIKHLNKNEFLKMQITIIDKKEQEKIVSNLDIINNIIELRKKQLKEYDSIIKSQFVEMFGDVINNQKHFEYKRIDEISEIVTGTTPNTNDYSNWNGNIKWITPAEIDKNTFIVNDTERKITEEGRKSKSLTIMPKGTVLFTTRAPIGKTAITGDEMCCNQGFKNCICKKDINNIYLYFVLKYNANYFDCLGTGATFRELSKTNFSKIKISVPPIDLQNKFAEFVKQIDKQKFESEIYLRKIQKNIL